jgi:hypothetical protein
MAMTEDELKNLLIKLSVQSIYHLSNGSEDVITVQEAIEKNGFLRPIVNYVQIMNVINHSDSEKDITFVLSPDYLFENVDLVFGYGLNDIMWTFSLPKYDIDEPNLLADDATGKIEMISEEGVVNWLIRGSVEIKQVGEKIYDLSIEEFHNSVFRTESN